MSKEAAEAVSKVFLKHRASLLRYAETLSRTMRGVDPEDIIQQAYFQAVRVYRPECGPGGVYTVLGHACRTVALDELRKARRYADKSFGAAEAASSRGTTIRGTGPFQAIGFEEALADPLSPIEDAEALALMEFVESNLPENYQGVLALRYFGFSQEEAAALMGLTKSAYKSRLYRAKAKAQEILGPAHQFESIPRPNIRIAR